MSKKGIAQTPAGKKCRYCKKDCCLLKDYQRRMRKCYDCEYQI